MSFDWSASAEALKDFGGTPITIQVLKSGLPYFDVLRLYGAIDLYVGLREDVEIRDMGDRWMVVSRSRIHRLKGRPEAAFREVFDKKKPTPVQYCEMVRVALTTGQPVQVASEEVVPVIKALQGIDAVLQSGIRDSAASEYETLQTGYTSPSSCCVARISLSDGILAYAGKQRIETVGEIIFLPIFEGKIDLSRVVSPLRAWIGAPNVLCCQALILLALKTSLFAEGYQDRLSAVAFNTTLRGQRSDNYSGLIAIAATAIGRIQSPDFAGQLYRSFRRLVGEAWTKSGESKSASADAIAAAHWLLQPNTQHFSAMVTSQEKCYRMALPHFFVRAQRVREVFEMTYGNWNGDHGAVRRFARAVASGIRFSRMADEDNLEERRKAWYGEVVLLRTASDKTFMDRAMM